MNVAQLIAMCPGLRHLKQLPVILVISFQFHNCLRVDHSGSTGWNCCLGASWNPSLVNCWLLLYYATKLAHCLSTSVLRNSTPCHKVFYRVYPFFYLVFGSVNRIHPCYRIRLTAILWSYDFVLRRWCSVPNTCSTSFVVVSDVFCQLTFCERHSLSFIILVTPSVNTHFV